MANESIPEVEPIDLPDQKRYSRSMIQLAKSSWVIPLCGLCFTIVFNVVAPPLGAVGAVGAVVFIAAIAIGFLIAVVSLVLGFQYRGMTSHAIGGLVTAILLAIAIVAMFQAVATVRAAKERLQQRQKVEQREPSFLSERVDRSSSSVTAHPR
jgi:hypothetical protein